MNDDDPLIFIKSEGGISWWYNEKTEEIVMQIEDNEGG